MSDSNVTKIVDNMKKIQLPVDQVNKIVRGFSGAKEHREEYAAFMDGGKPTESKPTESKPTESKPTASSGVTRISLNNDMSNWNAGKNNRVKADKDGVTITMPKGGYASGGGVNLKFLPDGIKKSSEVTLEYELFIPKDYDFNKGGKIGLGFNINDGTGGKSWKKNDGSYRLMWRRGGQCVSYLYLPTDQGAYVPGKVDCPLLKNQGRKFMEAISNKAPAAGLDLFRFTSKKMHFKRGEWNKIRMSARLNDPKKNNGFVELSLNGTSMVADDMVWTANPGDNKFTQLQMACWFGGSDRSWAPKKDESIKIRNAVYTFKKYCRHEKNNIKSGTLSGR
jgi:hypothetical protein